MLQLFVGNFGFNVQDEDLLDFFTPYGEVISAEVITDKFTNKSRGCGHVIMKDRKAGQRAMEALRGFEVDRNIMTIEEVKMVTKTPGNSKRNFIAH